MKLQKLILIILCICSFIEGHAQLTHIHTTHKGRDLVYDSITDRIYITIPSIAPENANSIGVINPHTGELESTLYVGDEPTEMAISDNGQYIYVAFKGVPKVRRYILNPLTFDLEFELGIDPNMISYSPDFYASNIEVMPGNPNIVAVTRFFFESETSTSPHYIGGIGIYNNGEMLPNDYYDYMGGLVIGFRAMRFKDSNTLVAHATSTPTRLGIFTITEEGLNLEAVYNSMPNSHPYDTSSDFIYSNEKLYFMNGRIINVSSTPYLEGQMTSNLFDLGAVTYDSANNLVCYGHNSNVNTWHNGGMWSGHLKRFNSITKELYDSNPITTVGDIDKIITCGDNCYAMLMEIFFPDSDSVSHRLNITRFDNLTVSDIVQESISVYPNPTSGIFNINHKNIDSILVYDYSGKKIIELKNNTQIDLSNYSSGIYFCKVITPEGSIFTEKIIKN